MPINRDNLAKALKVFSSLPIAVTGFFSTYEEMYLPESQAAEEFATFPGDEGVKTAYNLAFIGIKAAADHMYAMERVLASEMLSFAPWSTARAILEMTSLARWLLQQNLTPLERIGRGMTVRLQSFNDAIQYGRDIQKQSPIDSNRIVYETEKLIEELRQDAASRKIIEKLNKKDRLIGFNEQMPGATSLIEKAFDNVDM